MSRNRHLQITYLKRREGNIQALRLDTIQSTRIRIRNRHERDIGSKPARKKMKITKLCLPIGSTHRLSVPAMSKFNFSSFPLTMVNGLYLSLSLFYIHDACPVDDCYRIRIWIVELRTGNWKIILLPAKRIIMIQMLLFLLGWSGSDMMIRQQQ